jgi:ATP-dependent DNA helicase RecG
MASSRRGRGAEPATPLALAGVDALPGLGPSARAQLAEGGVHRVVDLVWTLPSGWDDLRSPRSLSAVVAEATAGEPVRATFAGIVESSSMVPIFRRRCVRVVLRDPIDATCKVHAFWFFFARGVLAVAKPDVPLLVTGKVTVDAKAKPKKPPRTAHPELTVDSVETRTVRPRYPRLGPSGALVKKAIHHGVSELTRGPMPVDPVPPRIAAREAMRGAQELLRRVHAIDGDLPDDEDRRRFVERLAWAEAFTRAWERLLAAETVTTQPAVALPPAPKAASRLARALGFELTEDQRKANAEIARELAGATPMRRLLLGDVGTGKTAVALFAAAQALSAGRQAAILAPTSVLAEQYIAAVKPLELALGVKSAFITADLPLASRRHAEAALASGEARIAIGTHALLGEGVVIPELALVIVDEQQRLGVGQRLAFVKKGERPHLLSLSATPIPRTLALALRGELATSTLRQRPAGRKPVATSLAPRSAYAEIVDQVKTTIERGERVFWIVPRVEENEEDDETNDLASAEARTKELAKALGGRRVGMIHGRMSGKDKRTAMNDFRSGKTPVLVGTTVVEVGVDVAEATLMVVEDAERYGLSQLHQLRGRVGRGERPGACVLLHGEWLDGTTRRRLQAMTELDHGDAIALADLKLRGAGALGGTRQHGEDDELVYLDPAVDYPWLERIEEDARAIRRTDPELSSADHAVLAAFVARWRRVLAVRADAG